ncbi:MAG: zinc-binding dehydrogenase [Thermoanaerobaculales bacterium]
MRALMFARHGETDQLTAAELTKPHPGPGEAVVAVRAAALNHLDLFVLRGLPGLGVSFPHIGGADGAGVVAEVGDGVTTWKSGDEVIINPGLWCGICEFCTRGEESECVTFRVLGEHIDGTFAEFVRVPAACLAPRPQHLGWIEAAALPLTFLTAWRMLVTRARLRPGETVLIHGVGGGVAMAALAIAKRAGAWVIVTSSDEGKLKLAKQLGADATINYATADVSKEVRSLTGKRGVEVVVETGGAATWGTSLRCAAKGGRLVTCGATTGPNPSEEIPLIFWKQLSILGSTMGSRADWLDMLRAVGAWGLRPVVDTVVPLERGRAAYERLARGQQSGKIVLSIDGTTADVTGA